MFSGEERRKLNRHKEFRDRLCLVAQSCLTLCDPMDCSPPGSSVHGILQARILEWAAISFSRGSSQESNPGLPHCGQTLYPLSHQGSPEKISFRQLPGLERMKPSLIRGPIKQALYAHFSSPPLFLQEGSETPFRKTGV